MNTKTQKQQRAEVVLRQLEQLFPHPEMILQWRTPFELLVAVMLSAQTTDKQVNKTTDVLFQKYQSIDAYADADIMALEQDLNSIGLYKQKARRVKHSAELIRSQYNGQVPTNISFLTALPGVGRKTANVVQYVLTGTAEGIAVDTHVQRLAFLFQLTTQTDPIPIEQDLMRVLPKERWGSFTYRMVEYGRHYCPARCTHKDCPIFNKLKQDGLV